MILKKLYELSEIKIESLLVKEQKRLKLSNDELIVLFGFFSLYKRSLFSINSLTRRTGLNQNQVESTVDSLLDKGLVVLSLESKEGKEREIFSLDPTFNRLEQLILEDIKLEHENRFENDIAKSISILENNLNRSLSSSEFEMVKEWYSLDGFTSQQVLNAIEQSNKTRISVKLINSILHQPEVLRKFQPLNDEGKKVINEIFKAIR